MGLVVLGVWGGLGMYIVWWVLGCFLGYMAVLLEVGGLVLI